MMHKHKRKSNYLLLAIFALITIICYCMEKQLRSIDELSYVRERLMLLAIPGVFAFILLVAQVVVLIKGRKSPNVVEVITVINGVFGMVIFVKYGIWPLWQLLFLGN